MRLAILQVSPEFLVDQVKPTVNLRYYRVLENALPEDAKVIRGQYNRETNAFEMVIESTAFDDVVDGQQIPRLPIPITQVQNLVVNNSAIIPNPCCGYVGFISPGLVAFVETNEVTKVQRILTKVHSICPNCGKVFEATTSSVLDSTEASDAIGQREFAVFDAGMILKGGG
jgi:hypothetical protein